jgi:hypothetical protein
MASATSNHEQALDLTEAVITLQDTIQGFLNDTKIGRQDFVLTSIGQQTPDIGRPTVLALTAANEEVRAQLEALEDQLRSSEKQLRSQGRWHRPARSSHPPLPTVLDISDLSNATNLLSHLITKTSYRETPQPSFAAYSWTWDPTWHEFYTYIPSQQTYVYLSRWKLNEVRNVWEHVSMANNILPDAAAEMFGAWEDWEWDPVWGQWYLEVEEKGTDEKCHVFPSQWQIQENGEWEYVGRIGQ